MDRFVGQAATVEFSAVDDAPLASRDPRHASVDLRASEG
jgi:hypothetical protein